MGGETLGEATFFNGDGANASIVRRRESFVKRKRGERPRLTT